MFELTNGGVQRQETLASLTSLTVSLLQSSDHECVYSIIKHSALILLSTPWFRLAMHGIESVATEMRRASNTH